MRSLTIAACFVFLSASACTWMKGASTNTPPSGAQTAPAASGSQSTQAPPPSQPVPSVDNSAQKSASGVEPPAPTPITPPVKPANPAKSKSTSGDQPIKAPAAAPKAPQAPAAPAPPLIRPAAPPTLNLADLEQRLRDTRAIGVFTKLSLKNQVDDLLSDFRALYKSPGKHPSSELRQRYDLLLLKVLSLLQDSDPSLAAAISSSRESIWGILADPDKFEKI